VEPSQQDPGRKAAKRADSTRVTVELDNPRTGETISTQTLAAGDIHEAATKAAGYVARQIFAMDPSTPAWCFGAADGGDLAALLLSRQERVSPVAPDDVVGSRSEQIERLKKGAVSSRCAGVVRYELAQLYTIQGEPGENQLTALRLHAVNREHFPRFYRGRYRLGMSLEMVADHGFRFTGDKAQEELDEILRILHRCGLTEKPLTEDQISVACADGRRELTPALRLELLKAAQQELRGVRRQLTIGRVLWAAFRHRDERAIWRVYCPGLRMRQSFHDGVCVAELLVAARRRVTEQAMEGQEKTGTPEKQKLRRRFRPVSRRHLRLGIRVAAAIAGSDSLIETIPAQSNQQKSQGPSWPPAYSPGEPPPVDPRDRLRRLPLLCRTASWQAAYNTACLYAALASERLASERLAGESLKLEERLKLEESLKPEWKAWEHRVVMSLERVVYNQQAEMERPYDLIYRDPDFSALRCASDQFTGFKSFLDNQRGMDYADFDADASLSWGSVDLLTGASPRTPPAELPPRPGRARRARRSRRPSGRAAVRRRRSPVPRGRGRVCGRRRSPRRRCNARARRRCR